MPATLHGPAPARYASTLGQLRCAAIEQALAEFRELEERSSVGWTRVIVGVRCWERA